MKCPDCGGDMGEPVDTTFSTTGITTYGVDPKHTGDIYYCEKCDVKWLDDFIEEKVRVWHG